MATSLKPITKQQYLITIKGIDSYWEKFSGIKDKANTGKYNDGITNRNFTLVGPRELGEMDIEKAFDPVADKPIVAYWKNFCDGKATLQTVSIVPVTYCPQTEPISPGFIIYGVRPISFEIGEADRTSMDVSKLKLSFAADTWEYS